MLRLLVQENDKQFKLTLNYNRCLYAKKLCDIDFISYVQSFDILLLGETWISKDYPSDFNIKGFECSHVFAQKLRVAATAAECLCITKPA